MDVDNFLACAVHVSTLPFPAPFCVLQGIPGDGMANTMDHAGSLTTVLSSLSTPHAAAAGGEEEEEERPHEHDIRFESSTEDDDEPDDELELPPPPPT